MEHLNNFDEKPIILYPCDWVYKVIGRSQKEIQQAVKEVLHTRWHTLAESHHSAHKNFISFTLTVCVDDEADRDGVFHALKAHELIFFVL